MPTEFNLTSTASTPWIPAGPGPGGSIFVLLSGTGSCRLEYSWDGVNLAAPDDTTMTGPGSYGFTLPGEVSHVRVTNVSGNSVGGVSR